MSSEDKSVRPKDKFGKESDGLALIMLSVTEYKVVKVKTNGKNATAKLEITHPNPGALLGIMMKFSMSGDEASGEKVVEEKIASGEFPMTTTTGIAELVREDGEWRIYEGYKIKDKIKDLTAEAGELEKQGRYNEAVTKFDEILALKTVTVEAKNKIQEKRKETLSKRIEVQKKADKAKENAAYIDQVKLYAFEATYFDTYLEKHVPGVSFKLKNEGEKTLNHVEVTVYFKDASGGVITEKSFNPIYTKGYSENAPLKPGYIWQLEQGKLYTVKTVPSEWKDGAAIAKITKIEIATD